MSLLVLSALLLLLLLSPSLVVLALRIQDHTRISHDTYYLGSHQHPDDEQRRVDGYAFLHLHHQSRAARTQRKLPLPVSKAVHFSRKELAVRHSCSSPIADGASWRTSRGYSLNVKNAQSLTPRFLIDAIAHASDAWRCVLNAQSLMVIGPLLHLNPTLSGHDIVTDKPTGENVIGMGAITGKPGTVAVTIVWGIFNGPTAYREITEFKMIFDQSHYHFGNASVRHNVIDLQATATHEWGHALGLDDIYDTRCSDVTMFGTSVENEIKKRSLETSDRQGLRNLYT